MSIGIFCYIMSKTILAEKFINTIELLKNTRKLKIFPV
ncbi:hypothetical protein Cst_c23230 [Thermoclostridium stercorarium subsp. stercorarium DSM 8532]|uniref:Uncharacterized protein n=1 Tax=Thermoclostridium stercorarium (strain ATCC 35414 / DSM 8532 / NCIMB 11754) TaxID=1121335 RepID=L7VUL9_THES1|nr:hypothetical protein Cst_c23230 [Thermoclostridium stercorarium subsp. stercorarium DSM 8532]